MKQRMTKTARGRMLRVKAPYRGMLSEVALLIAPTMRRKMVPGVMIPVTTYAMRYDNVAYPRITRVT